MKALVCGRFGAQEQIPCREVSTPAPGPGEVLIRVRAADAVVTDVLFALGKHQHTPQLPFVLGTEFAGEVAQVGPGAQPFTIGDRVAGLAIDFGGFALIPSSATAQHALRQRAALRRIADRQALGKIVLLP